MPGLLSRFVLPLSLGVSLLGGCASQPRSLSPLALPDATDIPSCRAFYAELADEVGHQGVNDAQTVPLPGYPHYRVDRFLAATATLPARDAWLDLAQASGLTGSGVELANLQAPPQWKEQARNSLQRCSALLRRADENASGLESVRRTVAVPPEYQSWKQLLGLYWLTVQPMKWGVTRLHREIGQTFATPLDTLPVEGNLISYAPPEEIAPLSPEELKPLLKAMADHPLGTPALDPSLRERLFATFAPTWEVDVASWADQPGEIVLEKGQPRVNTAKPMVYRHLSHTRFQGRTLTQLNYILWFPARPMSSPFDLLGGNLDGLTWRVTLGTDGQPLLQDTIHNCGCYHLFFPAPGLKPKEPETLSEEAAFAPQPLESAPRATIRLAHGSHFVQRVHHAPSPLRVPYAWEEYQTLRSLPDGAAHRSLFGADGIVTGSERGERWLFWPMGVPEPGAMRQWGHHATSFSGQRHFDDADLLDRLFHYTP
ncbi:MAG: hypothetical protein HQL56_02780 [Magnetococcales bacterium]|nr:hypothetical protein [Magnetococcales bacterium]